MFNIPENIYFNKKEAYNIICKLFLLFSDEESVFNQYLKVLQAEAMAIRNMDTVKIKIYMEIGNTLINKSKALYKVIAPLESLLQDKYYDPDWLHNQHFFSIIRDKLEALKNEIKAKIAKNSNLLTEQLLIVKAEIKKTTVKRGSVFMHNASPAFIDITG